MIDKDIVEKYNRQLKARIIAVDFDNTITLPCPYPYTGELNKTAKKYLDKLHNKGYRLVLWSARIEKDYEEAYNLCVNKFGMPYIEKDTDDLVHGVSGKLVASFYIDDLAYPKKLNWKKLYKYITKNI